VAMDNTGPCDASLSPLAAAPTARTDRAQAVHTAQRQTTNPVRDGLHAKKPHYHSQKTQCSVLDWLRKEKVASASGGEGTEGRNGGVVARVAMHNHTGGSENVQSPKDSPNNSGRDMDVAMDTEPCRESGGV